MRFLLILYKFALRIQYKCNLLVPQFVSNRSIQLRNLTKPTRLGEEPFGTSNVLGLALIGRRSYELCMEDTHSVFPDNRAPGLPGSFPINISSTGTCSTNRIS